MIKIFYKVKYFKEIKSSSVFRLPLFIYKWHKNITTTFYMNLRWKYFQENETPQIGGGGKYLQKTYLIKNYYTKYTKNS